MRLIRPTATRSRRPAALRRFAAPAAACLALLFGAAEAAAQPSLLLRLAPEVGLCSLEWSIPASQADGPALTASGEGLAALATASIGLRAALRGGLLWGLEVDGAYAPPGALGGAADGMLGGADWSYRDHFGAGVNGVAGLDIGSGTLQLYGFAGLRRMWSEFDGEPRARWPTALGAGLTINGDWLVDLRVRASRSRTAWTPDPSDASARHEASTRTLSFSVGVGPPRREPR